MTPGRTGTFTLFLVLWIAAQGCAVPQKMWPQKDMAPAVRTGTVDAPNILVASRHSAFKTALVDELGQQMASRGLSLEILGIEALETVEMERYDAVVIISTCLAWGFDTRVRAFVDRQPRHDKLILVTTSAAGDWLPDGEMQAYDAISAASEIAEVEAVARNVMSSLLSVIGDVSP